jgi:hypothetical protein
MLTRILCGVFGLHWWALKYSYGETDVQICRHCGVERQAHR